MEEGMDMEDVISAEDICMAAGVLLSLGFSYVPGINERFGLLSPTQKRLAMLALLALVTGCIFALSCLEAPVLAGSIACNQAGAWGLLRALALAAIANQAAYALSPRAGTYP
jgi:hypothetical protein